MSTAAVESFASDSTTDRLPPFVRRVRIRGYKSIEFCDVELEPLTVLVGPNGAGKSNFMDALAFARDAVATNPAEAVKRHGGWQAIRSRFNSEAEVSIQLELALPKSAAEVVEDSEPMVATYSFTIAQGLDEYSPVVAQERFLPAAEKHPRFDRPESNRPDRIAARLRSSPPVNPLLGGVPWPDQLWIDKCASDHPLVQHWLNGLRFMSFYNFIPAEIRKLQPADPSPLLEADGRNLAMMMERIRRVDPDITSRIGSFLSAIVPEIEHFQEVQFGDYRTLRFWLRTTPPLEFDASSMSDGTLRVLATLVAAYQIQRPWGPSLVGIEEPETALHPAAMSALVGALDETTLRTPILLTTHSAEMLDNPTIEPRNVRVVQMVDGRTRIGTVDAASVEIVRRNLNTLGGLERENQLERDVDDQSRQQKLASKNGEPQ